MQRIEFLFSLFLVLLTTFAQPGICPCWMQPNVAEVHLHYPGQADTQHDHEYLLEMFAGGLFEAPIVMLLPASFLLIFIFTVALYRAFPSWVISHQAWRSSPPTPPPRFAQTI